MILTPYKEWHPVNRIPEDTSEESLELFENILELISPYLKSLIKTQIDNSSFDLYFHKPKWEEECVPDTGADGFKCKGMIMTKEEYFEKYFVR